MRKLKSGVDFPFDGRLSLDVHPEDGDQRSESKDQGQYNEPVLHLRTAWDLDAAVDCHKEEHCHAEVEQHKEDGLGVCHVNVVVEAEVPICVSHVIGRSLRLSLRVDDIVGPVPPWHVVLIADVAKLRRGVRVPIVPKPTACNRLWVLKSFLIGVVLDFFDHFSTRIYRWLVSLIDGCVARF